MASSRLSATGLYLTLMLAAVTVVRTSSRVAIIAGVTTAIVIVSTYSVCTRLFPDRLGAFTDPQGPGRLYAPVGYWNGAAELAAIGLGVVMCAFVYVTSPRLRIALSATLPVLALAVFFTYSRGPILALAGGVVVVLALEPRRVSVLAWLIAQSVVPAALVATAASLHRLSGADYGRASAAQGHRLAALLVAACAVCAFVGWAVSRLEARVRGSRRVRTWFLRAIPVAAVAALAVLAVVASPRGAVNRIERSFHSSGPAARSSARLASVSPDSRLALWSVAWDTARRHPLIGAGAGSFETEWLAHRTQATDTRFAHSVFLEAAAEGGLPGLALTAAVLLGPLVAAVRLRRRPGVCLAAGAYAVFVIHASFDWDWELPAVTAAGLWCAAALLADAGSTPRDLRAGAARRRGRGRARRGGRRRPRAGGQPRSGPQPPGRAGRRLRRRAGGRPGPRPDGSRGRTSPTRSGERGMRRAAICRGRRRPTAVHVDTAPSAWSAWFGLAQVTTGRRAGGRA